MRIHRTWAWLAPALILLAALLSIALTPVTLVVDGGLPEGDVERGEWEEVPEATPSTVVIRSDGGRVAIGMPALRWPEVFNEELVARAQGFRADPATGGFVADGPGRLVLRGVFGDLYFGVLPESTASVTVVRRSLGRTLETTLEPGATVRLRPPVVTYQRSTAFLWRSIPARLADPGQANLRAYIGNLQIDAAGADQLSFGRVAPKALLLFLQALLAFALASLVVVFGWLVARSLDPVGDRSARWIALQAIAGVALLAVATNTLAYFLPTRWISWLILAAGLAVIAMRAVKRAGSREDLLALGRLTKLIGLALIPAALLFLPVMHWGLWYAGQYNTDLYQYTHLSSLLRDHSMLAMRDTPEPHNSGLIAAGAGFEWKSIDSASASALSIVTSLSSLNGIVMLSIALFLLFAIGVFGLLPETIERWKGRAIALLALVSPAFVLLFVENYQSHYYFVAFLPGLVLAAREFFQRDAGPSPSARRYCCLLAGAIAASILLVYPYFAAFALLAVAATPFVLRYAIKTTIRTLIKAAVCALALINIGVITFLYLDESKKWQEGLDAIATNVLLAPYSKSQYPFIAAGTTPYSWRWPEIDASPFFGWVGGHIWNMAGSAWTPGVVEVAALALVIGVFLLGLDWKVSVREFAFVASVAMVATFAGLTLFFVVTDSSYSTLKLTGTAAAVMPLILVTARLRRRWTGIFILALVPIALLWLRTDLLDRANWMIPRQGAAASLSHSSLQPELKQIRDQLEGEPESVALVRGDQPIAGSDRDNVVYNHIRVMIRELGIDCADCASYPLVAADLTETVQCDTAPGMIVSIGRTGREEMCGKPLSYSGTLIEIYR